jgi:16S rRNA (guanine527-N7)-methyltransferase
MSNKEDEKYGKKSEQLSLFLGREISLELVQKLENYCELIQEESAEFNLTSLYRENYWSRHICDALSAVLLPEVREARSLIDLGSGAGLPGIPLALILSDCRVTLLDARKNRCQFLERCSRELGLRNVSVIEGRAEEFGKSDEHREKYSIVVSRALSALPVVLELSSSFCENSGSVVAYKGPEVEKELESVEQVHEEYALSPPARFEYKIPDTSERGFILLSYQKQGTLAEQYPRRLDKIKSHYGLD